MCRMIMAQGHFSVAAVMNAARAMSCGETAQHDGPIRQHPNGWGCLWLDNGKVRTLRGTGTFADALPSIDIDSIRGQFLAVHVRHATLSKNTGGQFSHPLLHTSGGTQWYMMHNGFLPTIYQHLGMESSRFDSSEYLQYIVDPITPAGMSRHYLQQKMAQIAPGGSSGNAFFITREKAWAWQWYPDDSPFPHYFTLHCYEDNHTKYISSEIIPGLATAGGWRRMNNHELQELTFAE
ncbi:class II glutamine amidotransferase [Pantoea sp. B65]|uniref:class II glutamine amidotransferase n=1 Tax=Pantoea sp. B65 TaxID=2813359 RepID=UPI0039B3CF77